MRWQVKPPSFQVCASSQATELFSFPEHLLRAKPIRSHLKARKPQYSPPQLSVYITRKESHNEWMRAARHYYACRFSAIETMPKDSPCADFGSDVTKRRAGQPSSVKETLEDSGHSDPPNGIRDYEVIGRIK